MTTKKIELTVTAEQARQIEQAQRRGEPVRLQVGGPYAVTERRVSPETEQWLLDQARKGRLTYLDVLARGSEAEFYNKAGHLSFFLLPSPDDERSDHRDVVEGSPENDRLIEELRAASSVAEPVRLRNLIRRHGEVNMTTKKRVGGDFRRGNPGDRFYVPGIDHMHVDALVGEVYAAFAEYWLDRAAPPPTYDLAALSTLPFGQQAIADWLKSVEALAKHIRRGHRSGRGRAKWVEERERLAREADAARAKYERVLRALDVEGNDVPMSVKTLLTSGRPPRFVWD